MTIGVAQKKRHGAVTVHCACQTVADVHVRGRGSGGLHPLPTSPPPATSVALLIGTGRSQCLAQARAPRPLPLSPVIHPLCADQPSIGAFLGWGSSLLLSGARVPQILHILRSRRVADLSPSLFGLTICGNITQMASVVAYSSDSYYLAAQIPFLLGCGAPIVLDSIIVALIARYSATPPMAPMTVPLEGARGRRVPYV